MPRHAADDLDLLADRLRLGIPLTGFDGRAIPLRDTTGRDLDPIEAAHELLRSATMGLPADQAGPFMDDAIRRAQRVESASCVAGELMPVVTSRVTGVLVSAAIRAMVIARGRDASPTDLNRATLAWFHRHGLLRRQLLDATFEGQRLSA